MSVPPTPIKKFGPKQGFFGVLPKNDDEDPRIKRSVDRALTSSRKWTDAHLSAPSSRQVRRVRNRDIDRQTKKFRKQQRVAARAAVKHNERQAVIVLAAIEKGHGLEPGGLREQLIEDGALTGRQRTHGRNIGEHGGYTPVEILSAAGLTPEKIAEAHAALAGGDAVEDAA